MKSVDEAIDQADGLPHPRRAPMRSHAEIEQQARANPPEETSQDKPPPRMPGTPGRQSGGVSPR